MKKFRPSQLFVLTLLSCFLSTSSFAQTQAAQKSSSKIVKKNTHKKASKTALKKTPKASTDVKADHVHYNEWKDVIAFQDYMVNKHQFDKKQLTSIFEETRYIESAVQLMKPAPPGQAKNWQAYRNRFVETRRINAGVAFWNENEATLKRAENLYGVPAEIIVGLIGVETFYGKYTGNFRVFDALTTLAFSYPETPNKEKRQEYFKSELEQMLLWTREKNEDLFSFKGSYAGAIGLCQFMPSSIRAYAIDFDGDEHINLRESAADAIGSVANYLAIHGWNKSLPLVYPAKIIDEANTSPQINVALSQGLKATYLLNELNHIAKPVQENTPDNIQFGLVDLQNGDQATQYWYATNNFYAITYYNRSYFYAMSVIELGKEIFINHQ